MRLLKLLYIAERECLAETGRPFLGGRAVAMKRGMLPEPVFQLIKGEHPDTPEWARFFHCKNYEILMSNDPGNDQLSMFEVEKLNEVRSRYAHLDEFGLAELTHKFEEWKQSNPGDSSVKIQFEDLLRVVGRLDDKDEMLHDISQSRKIRALLAEP